MKHFNNKQTLRYLPLGLLVPAQTSVGEAGSWFSDLLSGTSGEDSFLLLGAALLVFFLIILALVLMAEVIAVHSIILKKIKAEDTATEAVPEVETTGFWKWFWDKFNGAADVNHERDILLEHDYDGIHELDNNLPPWWKYGFYFTMVFAVVYIFRFHISWDGDEVVSIQEYNDDVLQAEMAKAEFLVEAEDLVDESNVVFLDDAASLETGQKIFDFNCKVCHGGAGEGGVGPNLTDNYWLHGGTIKDIFKTIKYGVPEKGMLAWKDNMRPLQIQEVSSYIMTLAGTNPPNPKEPQGEEFIPED